MDYYVTLNTPVWTISERDALVQKEEGKFKFWGCSDVYRKRSVFLFLVQNGCRLTIVYDSQYSKFDLRLTLKLNNTLQFTLI